MKLKIAAILFVTCLSGSAGVEIASLSVRGHLIHAEIANNPKSFEHGLKGRTTLCENCGMLFVYKVAGLYAFWMKDTSLPLSVAFIAPDARIINISDMVPFSTALHFSGDEALYVLEMPRGWFESHNIKPGDEIKGIHSPR